MTGKTRTDGGGRADAIQVAAPVRRCHQVLRESRFRPAAGYAPCHALAVSRRGLQRPRPFSLPCSPFSSDRHRSAPDLHIQNLGRWERQLCFLEEMRLVSCLPESHLKTRSGESRNDSSRPAVGAKRLPSTGPKPRRKCELKSSVLWRKGRPKMRLSRATYQSTASGFCWSRAEENPRG